MISITVPLFLKNHQIDRGSINAETTVINGVEYETYDLPGNADVEQTRTILQVSNNGERQGNYRYVLQSDLDLRTNKLSCAFYGQAIILDLNGHVVSSCGITDGGYFFYFHSTILEITDSSAGGGCIDIAAMDPCVKTLTFSGNTDWVSAECSRTSENPLNINVHSGKGVYMNNWVGDSNGIVWMVPPYLLFEVLSDIACVVRDPYHRYAVSSSDIVMGAHNTAYGLAWDMTANALFNLAIPSDKTYYLWGRNADGWYQFLNLRYDPNQQTWVAA